ncbi:hypothetical protein OE749_16055 [Aestuariibacter sp. AA17]|uniref:Prokaryotic glutathione synthetase ATP-binding domain-containing protein n=1 Tax=Fluctibacter corallii TaxID=2984329 RepID=A0ABT3AD33_9ALTE|nr:hypothetical protein [Aestuariibacter sp. AA17]MCV2886207.1 hypothetical protein [Aestuariibacter sp. AA17]
MKRCAFLTMDDTSEFFVYDHLAQRELETLGWHVESVSWRDASANWDDFAIVVIRSPWDYQDAPEAFMKVLSEIDDSSAMLLNDFTTVSWNMSKTYLADLADRGIGIVPTQYHEHFELGALKQALAAFSTDKLVIKPVVSANADFTYIIAADSLQESVLAYQQDFSDRPFMLQPYIHSIATEGEYSLFYFNGEYSHCILKTPKQGDFRVQEEHGGRLKCVEPEPTLLQAASDTINAITSTLLYARIDFIRHQDAFLLMEVELIEPSLYFNMDEQSAKRFADALEHTFHATQL